MHREFARIDRSPISDATLDLSALNQEIMAVRRAQIADEIKMLELQARVNRTLGAISDLTYYLEQKRKQATPVSPDAARA